MPNENETEMIITIEVFITLCTHECAYQIPIMNISIDDIRVITHRYNYVIFQTGNQYEIILEPFFELNVVKKIINTYTFKNEHIVFSEEELAQYREFTFDTSIYM